MTTAELCAAIDADTFVLLESVGRRLVQLDACLAASAQLIALARAERDRLAARRAA